MKSIVLAFSFLLLFQSANAEDAKCTWTVTSVDKEFKSGNIIEQGDVPVLSKDENYIYFMLNKANEGKFINIHIKSDNRVDASMSHGNDNSLSDARGAMDVRNNVGFFQLSHTLKKADGSFETLGVSCIKKN